MELVQEFARSGAESAFGEIVRRHLNLVHSVALRCTGHEGDAQDVTQAVFILLARKAGSLSAKTVLPGWLYETTRFTASRLQRTNIRRHAREQEAYMQSTLNDGDTTQAWAQLEPHLESAMSGLEESDRALLVLRFYQNQTAAQTAAQLGIQADAAHKRTTRALDKLRNIFAGRGITLSTTAIAAAVSAHSVQAAPMGLGAKITSAAVISAAVTHGTGLMSVALQKALVSLLLVAAVGLLIYQTQQARTLRVQIETLKEKQAPLLVTIQQLQRERDDASRRAESLKEDLAKTEIDNHELIRLRGEVGVLRQTQSSPHAQTLPKAGGHYDVIIKHMTSVAGLVNLDDYKGVMLEFTDGFPDRPTSIKSRAVLQEGQSYDDSQVKDAPVKIEILAIDFTNGVVRARENSAEAVYRFEADRKPDGSLEPARLRLRTTGLMAVPDLYSILNEGGRTLLIHPEARKKLPMAITANPRNKAEAIVALEKVLSGQGFAIIPDGSKLAQVVPDRLAKITHPRSDTLPASKPEEELPGGMISLENVGFENVRSLYATLAGKKITQNGPISVTLSLRSTNPLSKAEVIYAFDILLAWQGVKIVPVDANTWQAVRFNATAQR